MLIAEDGEGPAADKLLLEKPDGLLMPYATRMFYCMGLLFLMLFGLSVAHFRRQKSFTNMFDQMNSSMEDFTLHIRGLPRCMNNEGTVKALLEQQLDCAGDIIGVSIGYDLTDPGTRDQVFDMFEHRIARADAGFHLMGHALTKDGWGYEPKLAKREQLDGEADRNKFRKLWDEGLLEGSGHAFVVFATKAAVSAARLKYRGFFVSSEVTFTAQQLAHPQLQFLRGERARLARKHEQIIPQNLSEMRTEQHIFREMRSEMSRFVTPEAIATSRSLPPDLCQLRVLSQFGPDVFQT